MNEKQLMKFKEGKGVKKAVKAPAKYPKCVICPENMGYAGHGIHSRKRNKPLC